MPATFTEGQYPSDWLKGEQQNPTHFSREQITVRAGSGSARSLTSGMVIAKRTTGAATAEADGGNTGQGAMSAVTVAANAKVGVYSVEFVEAASGGGRFEVRDPNGVMIGEGVVGSAFAQEIGFTISDGDPDFVVGDKFAVTVAAGDGKVVQIDFDEATGDEDAHGVLFADVEAPDGADAQGVAIVRNAAIVASQLTWPAGATTQQKATALAQLAANGVIERTVEA